MDGNIEIPTSGVSIRPVPDGNQVLLGDALSPELIRMLTEVQPPVIEMWALWRRSTGDVALLQSLSGMQRLHIINRTEASLAAVSDLKGLRTLSVESNRPFDVDLRDWPLLEELLFVWNGKFSGLSTARMLRSLRVWLWKGKDLSLLRDAPQLNNLELVKGSLRTLDGIEACDKLDKLVLSRITQLEDFTALHFLKSLRQLVIDTCKKLKKLDLLASLANLESLRLDNLGDIESLEPLRHNQKLRDLFFIESTNISDGNTDIVNDLPLVDYGFQNRKHYNYTESHAAGMSRAVVRAASRLLRK